MEDIKTVVKTFLVRFIRNHELLEDEDIFNQGSINSLFAMQLVMFLEQEFNIQIDNTDLDLENFKTINNITSLVERKLAS